MTYLFSICAVAGGTVLVCQFVLTLVGLNSEHALPDDLPDDVPHDLSGGDHGHHGGAQGQDNDSHLSSWLFGVISFRTLVAAATFFGLAGLAAQSAGARLPTQLFVAGASGVAAMYVVHWLMTMISRLGVDGTARIERAVGQEAVVYIPIPGEKARAGKVQLNLQNRLVEYEAVTATSERLITGTRVRVIGLQGNTLEVEPLHP